MMAALRQEMERQGMLRDELGWIAPSEWGARLGTRGEVVTPKELTVLMLPATNSPAPLNPPLLPDTQWREQWEQWLDFLVGALNYGGFRVE
jgi:hypothetical protein